MVLMGIKNIPLWGQLGLFLMSSIFQLNPLYVGAGSMKYRTGPLVPALSARAQDYGATNVAAGSPGLIGVDRTNTGLVTAVNSAGSAVAAASVLDSTTDAGGEIIVPKTYPLSAQEPTCEQLRAMWIFSKRQSRAAEVTNEIPTYRDPFVYNVWEPFYSSTRSFGASAPMLPRHGDRSRPPVFGRVINREPIVLQRFSVDNRQRLYGIDGSIYGGTSPRIYGSEAKTPSSYIGGGGSRRPSKYRHVGSNGPAGAGVTGGNQNSVNVQGSFQRLKELIWTERVKELIQQRKAEEVAARAAVLKEIANGQNIQSSYKPSKSESPLMDENRSPYRDIYQHLNDDRMSVATGNSHYIENNYNNKKNSNLYLSNANSNYRRKNGRDYYKGNGKPGNSISEEKNLGLSSSMRRYMTTNKYQNNKGVYQLKPFSQIANGGTGTSATVPRSNKYMDEDHNMGIHRAYPMRPSYFPERNGVLFKEDAPLQRSSGMATFSRNIRSQSKSNLHRRELMMLQSIIEDLKRYTFLPTNRKEYMENDMKISDDIFVDDFYPREHDSYPFSSIDEAVSKSYVGKATDKFAIYEHPATNKKDWDGVNTVDVNTLVAYVDPHISYSETADTTEFHDYENY